MKCTFSALNDPKWPKYLPIKLQEMKRTARLENEMIVEPSEKNTFEKHIPKTIRIIKDIKAFIKETRRYYRDKALTRS